VEVIQEGGIFEQLPAELGRKGLALKLVTDNGVHELVHFSSVIDGSLIRGIENLIEASKGLVEVIQNFLIHRALLLDFQ